MKIERVPDIILVNGLFNYRSTDEPIGICSIASVLRLNGHAIDIYDPRLSQSNEAETANTILKKGYNILGISITVKDMNSIQRFVKTLRNLGYRGHICVGGVPPSLHYQEYLEKIPEVDSVVVGDGEYTFLRLVNALKHGKENWRNFPGVASFDGKTTHFTKGDNIKNLDNLPFRATDFLEEKIKIWGAQSVYANISTSRGCYNKCTFCAIPKYTDMQNGPRYRLRSIRGILDEIEHIVEKFGVTYFNFDDDNLIPPGKYGFRRVEEFTSGLKKRNLTIRFSIQTRIDTFSVESIKLLKDVGAEDILLGVESVTDSTLSLFNKGYKASKVYSVMNILNSQGYSAKVGSKYRIRPGYINFHPLVTIPELIKTLEFFKKYSISPKLFYTRLYVGKENVTLIEEFEKQGLRRIGELPYPFLHPEIEHIYNGVVNFFNQVIYRREDLRRIEKTANVNNSLVSFQITNVREKIDSICMETCSKIVHTATKSADLKRDIDNIVKESLNQINNLCNKDGLQQLSEEYKQALNIKPTIDSFPLT